MPQIFNPAGMLSRRLALRWERSSSRRPCRLQSTYFTMSRTQ
jgi:hypothetical protein